jgi:zinc protease
MRDGELFAEVSCGLTDNLDSGGILIDARPAEDADYQEARRALFTVVDEMVNQGIKDDELTKGD